jgi:hypothetical protein
LIIGDAQKPGQVVGCQVFASRRFLGDGRRPRFGDLAAHVLGAFHHRPNLIFGRAIVPNPSYEPSVEIIGLCCADMARVQDDLAASLGAEVKIAVAPPPWRWYTFHCNDPSNLPRFARGIFCV